MKSKESFKVVYEKVLRKVERSDIFFLEFSATFTIVVGFATVIIIILVFLIFPKTRIASKMKIRSIKKQMIWNGAILSIQIGYLQQALTFADFLNDEILGDSHRPGSMHFIKIIVYSIYLLVP